MYKPFLNLFLILLILFYVKCDNNFCEKINKKCNLKPHIGCYNVN